MPRTIYRVEASSSGEQSRAAVSRGETRRPRRRTLVWVLVVIAVVILAMIVAIAALNAGEGEAMGALREISSTATYPGPAMATAWAGSATTDPNAVSPTASSAATTIYM